MIAREFGDIAENAEYDDAKNEQAMLEHKIAQLEERLAHARVIDTDDVDTSVVSIGSVVRLRDVDAKETVEYHIVGSAEANPAEQKLSNESPVGKAIIGRKKGETVEVHDPARLQGQVQDHGDQGRVAPHGRAVLAVSCTGRRLAVAACDLPGTISATRLDSPP